MFLPHFDVFCNLLLNRRTATWNLLSETWHLIAAIQLTVSCSELYFVRCCALKWKIRGGGGSNWKKPSVGGVWIFSGTTQFLNHFDLVSETPYSCDTVACELWRVILCSLLCPETDWKIRIGKQGYVFVLTDFKSDVFMFHSWHQSVC